MASQQQLANQAPFQPKEFFSQSIFPGSIFATKFQPHVLCCRKNAYSQMLDCTNVSSDLRLKMIYFKVKYNFTIKKYKISQG